MADVTAKSFRQLVQGMAAAVQATASGLLDFSTGSVPRAIVQAVAGVVLWLQGLILALLATTRLSTSTGADADSWIADWGGPFTEGGVPVFSRLGSAAASGDVTFTRLTPTGTALIPAGSTVETRDGTQRFQVIADTTNVAYDVGLGGYVLLDTVADMTVPVVGLSPGSASNVLAGTVTVITSPITGIDLVTNGADFTTGADAESDAAFSLRFRGFLQSLREATPAAIKYYVEAIQLGVSAQVVENVEPNGAVHKGFFYVIVDDGTGTPPAGILEAASTAVDTHRAAGIEYAIVAPTIITVAVAFGVVSSGIAADDRAAAQTAVRLYLNTRILGEDLIYARIYQVAFDSSPTITQITGLTVGGGTANISVDVDEVVKAGTVNVT